MKIKLNRDFFSTGLQQVAQVAKSQRSLSILSHVLVEASEDGFVRLSTSNLELGTQCEVKADVSEKGSIALPVHRLSAIVKELGHSDVHLESKGSDQVKLSCGGSTFHIKGLPADEFPYQVEVEQPNQIEVEQDTFMRMLKSVSYAQSTDENRHKLNGVYLSLSQGTLRLVATDGKRLALIDQSVSDKADPAGSESDHKEMILPARAVMELERLLGKGSHIRIEFNPKQAVFHISLSEELKEKGLLNEITLTSKLIEGSYPNYNQVIPKETVHRIKVERDLMQECVNRAALVVTDKPYSIKIAFKPNLMEIMGSSTQFGQSYESMAIQYEGPAIELTLNPNFLMDPLRALTRDELFFEFKDELSPGVFRSQDNFMCVIMPIRFS